MDVLLGVISDIHRILWVSADPVYRSFAIISLAYIYFLALLVRLLFKVLSIFLFLVL